MEARAAAAACSPGLLSLLLALLLFLGRPWSAASMVLHPGEARGEWSAALSRIKRMADPARLPHTRPVSRDPNQTICGDVTVRNHVRKLVAKLQNCTVVEGSVQIMLFADDSPWEGVSFPKLTEITGHLFVYRAGNLRSLGPVFPNLSVIRGNTLFGNYALVVYEMQHLVELGLSRLTAIRRGSVRMEKNPMLCFTDTIDWDQIMMGNDSIDTMFLHENQDPAECPPCPDYCPLKPSRVSGQRLCWDPRHCQRVCPSRCGKVPGGLCDDEDSNVCCDPKCLGGCKGASPGHLGCVACRNYLFNGNCVSSCPPNTFIFMERRCVDEAYCRSQQRLVDGVEQNYIPFDGACRPHCPPHYVRYNGSCRRCQGRCPKVCQGFLVDSVSSAQNVKDCTIINGSLVIQIPGAGNIMKELEANLQTIEEIQGYLKVTRSNQLISLNFLKNLRVIHGDTLDRFQYSLVVLDNQNLQMLWDWSSRPANQTLVLKKGSIFFHINPKLCLSHIDELRTHAQVPPWTSEDVSPHTNGDRVACNVYDLAVTLPIVRSRGAVIKWTDHFEKEADDLRTLLGYVTYYREAPHRNVTLYDGRDACKGDVWNMVDADVGAYEQIISPLKPFTQYAFYVKAYTLPLARKGAQSNITYFTTDPSAPSQPLELKARPFKDTKVLITWKPPRLPNGDVRFYRVVGEGELDDPRSRYLGEGRDYCIHPAALGGSTKSSGDGFTEEVQQQQQHFFPDKETSKTGMGKSCCSCSKDGGVVRDRTQEELLAEEQANFEDRIHNLAFLKRPAGTTYAMTPPDNRKPKAGSRRTQKPSDQKGVEDNSLATTQSVLAGKPGEDLTGSRAPEATEGPPARPRHRDLCEEIAAARENASDARAQKMFCTWVTNETRLFQDGLHRFTDYSIRVLACHKKPPRWKPLERDCETHTVYGTWEMCCSIESITMVRTLPVAEADDIESSTVSVHHENTTSEDSSGGIFVKWSPPKDPNGFVVSYQVEYKMADQEKFKPIKFCVSHIEHVRHGGRLVHGLAPGNYSFRVMASSLAGPGNWTQPVYFVIPEHSEGMSHGVVVALALFGALVALFAVGAVGFFYYRKKHMPQLPDSVLYASINPEYVSSVYEPDEWEVPRETIQLVKELGQGSFGMVYEGIAYNLSPEKPETKCAVKTVNESASIHKRIEFLQEASVMKAFSCQHVVKLLGVVSKGQPVYVIMELMSNGDLKGYLRSHRPESDDDDGNVPRGSQPTLKQILQMAAEIADGMAYLAAHKFVHRDLAARNCMVAEDLTVKIGDFGMTRDIYETDYYRKGGKGLLPVRWMAPESLKDGIFTSQSDIWSYGIVLWEMATLASQPYQGLSNEQVLKYVISGGIMERPENCPEKLYQIMKLCWLRNPRARPKFVEVIEMLLQDVNSRFREVSFYHTSELKSRGSGHGARSSEEPQEKDEEEEEEEEATAEAPLWQLPDAASLQEMDDEKLQKCFSDCIDDDDDDDEVPIRTERRTSTSERRRDPPTSLPSSDGSKGSKVSTVSNGSLANGRMCFTMPGGRTTAC